MLLASGRVSLSPSWPKFLVYYAGVYATVGSFTRPFRFGIAVGIAPKFDAIVAALQRRLKVPKPVAIGLVVVAANVVGTTVLMVSLTRLVCLLLRVPPILVA